MYISPECRKLAHEANFSFGLKMEAAHGRSQTVVNFSVDILFPERDDVNLGATTVTSSLKGVAFPFSRCGDC